MARDEKSRGSVSICMWRFRLGLSYWKQSWDQAADAAHWDHRDDAVLFISSSEELVTFMDQKYSKKKTIEKDRRYPGTVSFAGHHVLCQSPDVREGLVVVRQTLS